MARQCGSCTLCCRLLPVQSLDKPANQKCRHQSYGKGCTVYSRLWEVAPECKVWNCRWLIDEEVERRQMKRPDRAHYVIDVMPDAVTTTTPDGTKHRIPAVQVWVEPGHRDAHRDPKLRDYLAHMGEKHSVVAIIRYDNREGFVLVPPALNEGEWLEHRNTRAGPSLLELMAKGEL